MTLSGGGSKVVHWDEAELVFRVEDGNVHVDSLDVKQPSGSWRVQGTLPLAVRAQPIVWFSQFKHFKVSSVILDGEAQGETSAGKNAISWAGQFQSPSFWVNGYGLGALQGRWQYDGQEWSFTDLRSGEDVRGSVRFRHKERTVQGELRLEDAPLSEWAPRLGMSHTPFETGRVDASVTLDGAWSAPRAAFNARWMGAEWKTIPFDAVVDGEWTADRLNIKTVRVTPESGGAAEGEGQIALPVALSTSAVAFDFRIKDVPLSALFDAAGVSRDSVSGTIEGALRCAGPRNDLRLSGTLSGGRSRLWKNDVEEWKGKFEFQNDRIQIGDFSIKTPEGRWRIKEGSQIFLSGQEGGHFQLIGEMRNIHLGPLNFFGGLEVLGQWKRSPAPYLECHLRAQSLYVNQHYFDRDLARVIWTGRKLEFAQVPGGFQKLSGSVDLARWPQVYLDNLTVWENSKRRLWIQGAVGPEEWNFLMEGWDLEANTLLSLADMDWPLSGFLNLSVSGRGSPAKPFLEGAISGRNGYLGPVPYDRLESAVSWKGKVFEISDLEIFRKNGYLLKGNGSFPVAAGEETSDDYTFSLRLSNGDLRVLKDAWSNCRSAKGSFRGDLQIRPGKEGPQTSGHLVVENGVIHADRYFREMSDVNARLTLKNSRVIFDSFSGRVGGGRWVVKGDVGVRGVSITDYNLTLDSVGRHGLDIEAPQLAVPPGPLLKRFSLLRESLEGVSQGSPLVHMSVTGPHGQHRIAGTLLLEKTQFTYPPSKKKAFGARRGTWFSEFRREATWDLLFKTGGNTWYRNEFVNVQVAGDLRIQGRLGSMRVDGRVDAKQGFITYLGQTFRVRRGALEVVTEKPINEGDKSIIPYLSGEAEKPTTSVDPNGLSLPDTVTMIIDRAPIGEIQPRFYSRNSPGMSSERAAQKALGFTLETQQFTPEERDQLLRAGLVQLLGSTAGPLANSIAHRFGIAMLYPIYEPEETALTGSEGPVPANPAAPRSDLAHFLQGTGAKAGFQLSDRIFGFYKFKVDQTQNQFYFRDEVEFIYRIHGSLHIRASTELDTEKLLGQPPNRQAVMEHQWRFGLPKKRAASAPSSETEL
ncbi:MAG: translocation/assembly module TamB domain-containing protein [Elusimicrobia bacterium]|nr:translocation/assembly module TamB domain-containing protein [Elusimicrobiota bacterium]